MLPEDESQYPSPEEYNQETEFTLMKDIRYAQTAACADAQG